MKKSEKRLLIGLGLVASFFVYDTFLSKSDDEEVQPKVKKTQVLEEPINNTPVNNKKQIQRRNKPKLAMASMDFTKFSDWEKDPFLGSFTQAMIDSMQGSIPFVLKAIAWRDAIAHVIINDEVYKLGEKKNGLLVSEVRNNSVVCYINGQRFILTFGE